MAQPAIQRVVLITGTSSGFGLGLAVSLAQRGHQVIATMRDLARRHDLDEAAQQAGVEARINVLRLDVTETDTIPSVVDEVVQRFGRIDVLINNAGFAIGGFVEDIPLSEWRRQLETNLFGAIAMTQAVLPQMRVRKSGTIVNVSSISGRIGFPGMGPYVTSKFALEGFSEALRLEMVPYGVHVVLVEPASYKTSIWRKGLEEARTRSATPYPYEMQTMIRGVQHIAETAANPQEVVDLVARILDAPHPTLRYPIGRGVRGMLLSKAILPWTRLERMITKRFQH